MKLRVKLLKTQTFAYNEIAPFAQEIARSG